MRTAVCLLVGVSFVLPPANLPAQPQRAPTAQFSGTVVDVQGRPLTDMLVTAQCIGCPHTGPSPGAKTDSSGRFNLSTWEMVPMCLMATSEKSGYPDTRAMLYSDAAAHFPEFDVKPNLSISNIVIRMPEPNGVFTLRLVDASTHAPLSDMVLLIHLRDMAQAYERLSTRGPAHEFALPEKPAVLCISASGYERKPYIDSQTGQPFLLLKKGERRTVTVELRQAGATGAIAGAQCSLNPEPVETGK